MLFVSSILIFLQEGWGGGETSIGPWPELCLYFLIPLPHTHSSCSCLEQFAFRSERALGFPSPPYMEMCSL
ncbi:rCG28632 [Rattus norvegicus]|uniref:RCG28632 n=1 Tax=Rattus norvegicus TaxID=10116 RepID=A6HWH5_RAT|nr:rCG28632 [Rattus norvegicus]